MNTPPSILLVRSWAPQEASPNGGDQRLLLLQKALATVGNLEVCDVPRWASGHHRTAANERAVRWGWFWKPTPAGAAEIRTRAAHADVVVLHRLSAFWASGWATPRNTILDLDDIQSQVCQMGMGRGLLPVRLIKRVRFHWARTSEKLLWNRFRTVCVCSEDDRKYFNHPQVCVLPNVFTSHPDMDAPSLPPSHDLLFVGDLGYAPNSEGIAWFIRTVWPRVRAANPTATLTVVGRMPTPRPADWGWSEQPGVQLLGRVEDVGAYWRAAKVSICPLLSGMGTRIKILEALAFGVPTVSTTIGAYGNPLRDADGLFRADDPTAMADICVRLLGNAPLRSEAGKRGKERVRNEFSEERFKERVREIVTKLVNDCPKTRS